MISKRYTHDTIRPLSYYEKEKKVDLGFVGSCMVHKGDIKIVAQMLKNLEKYSGNVKFKAPLVMAPPTYNIVEELKAEGDWEVLQKYSGFEYDDLNPKTLARKNMKIFFILKDLVVIYVWVIKKRLEKVIQLWLHQQDYLKEEL